MNDKAREAQEREAMRAWHETKAACDPSNWNVSESAAYRGFFAQGFKAALQWAASQQAADGCTPTDAEVLRHANHGFAEENLRLRQALRFYAAREHFNLSDQTAWDTVSGEPQNWWCDEAGTATVEDGHLASMALRGEAIDWGEDGLPPVCQGEPEDLITAAPPSTQGGADEQR